MIPSPRPPQTEPGAVIGGYELVRRLGRGGMAEVWVAQRALGKGTKVVALKVILDHYVGDERYTRMFRAEAELAASLSHANIVQVFELGDDNGRSYLTMEWVDGLNLLKLRDVLALLDDDRRRFRVTAYIIGQLLYALGYAHSITSSDGSSLGIVHRDVSPQNVLISNHGEVKLTDFGVAYQVSEQSSGLHVKGKVRYMPPEQLGGKSHSPTVDLYAVGALLHELLDGKRYRGEYEDGRELFNAVLSDEIPPLSRPAPPELDELRVRLLAPDPLNRVQTAEEAIHLLQRYPRYGDARPDLTKLCSSLTGVVRPRVGPRGQSSAAPAARNLAKPVVRPMPVPQRAAAVPPPPTVPVTPPKQSRPKAQITGDTQFVSPQQVQQVATSKQAPPASAPEVIELSVVDMLPQGPAPSAGAATPKIPPTERLQSHGHDPDPARAGATEIISQQSVLDLAAANAAVERHSTSPPSTSPPPSLPAVAPAGAGPAPVAVQPRTNSISIPLPKRSTLVFALLGLVLLSLGSVVVTWWFLTRPAAPAEDSSTPSKAATPERSAAAVPEVSADERPGEDALAAEASVPDAGAGAPPFAEPSAGEATTELGDTGENEEVPTAPADPPAAPLPSPDPDPDPEVDAPAPSDAEPIASTPPEQKKKRAKGSVLIRGLLRTEGAQIQIGSQKFTLPADRKLERRLRVGTKKLQWRLHADDPWQKASSITIREGEQTVLLLSRSTLKEV